MNTLLTPQKLSVMTELMNLAPPGIFLEVGVYRGGSLFHMAKSHPNRMIFGFDTFEGMPHRYYDDDEHHKPGEFSDTSQDNVRHLLSECKNMAITIKGLFPDSARGMIHNDVAFAHLDMDHWRGTQAAMEFLWPQMVPGGILLFDDYNWKNCEGITPLVHNFETAFGHKLHTKGNQAWFFKGEGL